MEIDFFWSERYYVSTVGLNKNTIKRYIQNQDLEDKVKDQRNLKEYKDPVYGKVIVTKAIGKKKLPNGSCQYKAL
jgi:hypothetical protein